MRTILVTGANKGIGFAIAREILRQHDDTHVLLGSRDRARGQAAIEALAAEQPTWKDRVSLVPVDVGSDASVSAAVQQVREQLGSDGRLYAIVNNAGIGLGSQSLEEVLNVNTRGVHRVCESFLPLVDPARGRIVNVTSASGPNFVAECSDERKRFFLDGSSEWADLEALMRQSVEIAGDAAAFQKRGLGDGNAYGLSKACANTYTLQLARRHPELRINACTPGFIETDLTRSYAEAQGRDPAELGMKTPEEGARSAIHLLFGELQGSGHYYGSDCQRSPLDRYRAPGSAPYAGD